MILVWKLVARLPVRILSICVMAGITLVMMQFSVAEPGDSVSAKTEPGTEFQDPLHSGGMGPEMVVLPSGSFMMGCLSKDEDCWDDEKPLHEVQIVHPFAVSVYEVTFDDYDRFRPDEADDEGWGRSRHPVINVTWKEAQAYVSWLSEETGAKYRLLSESEWEYAARAGSTTKYSWGDEIGDGRANCDGCGSVWDDSQTAPVGSFKPNAFGLYDMHGNVWEWVEDCWRDSYQDDTVDDLASPQASCEYHVVRGGSWYFFPRTLRSSFRNGAPVGSRNDGLGFRVARTLTP